MGMHRNALAKAAAFIALPLLTAGAASAAAVGPFDFETGTAEDNQYTQNFLEVYVRNGGVLAQTDPADELEPNNDYLRMGQNGSTITVVTVLNTNPTKTLANANTFGNNLTISFDLGSNMPGGSVFGIYLFDPETPSDNLFAAVYFDQASANERLRFSYDGNLTTGSGGTQFRGNTITASGGFLVGGDGVNETYWQLSMIPSSSEASGTFTSSSITYVVGDNDDTTLTLMFGTQWVTWTIPDTLKVEDPAIAFYVNGYGSGSATWRIDNIAVVPEPAMISLLPAAGLLAMRRRRGVC